MLSYFVATQAMLRDRNRSVDSLSLHAASIRRVSCTKAQRHASAPEALPQSGSGDESIGCQTSAAQTGENFMRKTVRVMEVRFLVMRQRPI